MQSILVFQHISIEHPGVFRDYFAADGIRWDAVELDEGEPIPGLDGYDALWVMGGPMDVWQEDEHPWLAPEKAAIREAVVERRLPYFGFCLGHQLLADALGDSVGPARTPEIGVFDVEQTRAGQGSRLFSGLSQSMPCLQWHGAEVQALPKGAQVLASSPACAVQALQIGATAFSVQYHVEIGPTTVRDWARVPAYEQALIAAMGEDGLKKFDNATAERMNDFALLSRRLYDNWMAAATARETGNEAHAQPASTNVRAHIENKDKTP